MHIPKINEKLLGGRLKIKQQIGHGAQWLVFLASYQEDNQSLRDVVVKWPNINEAVNLTVIQSEFHGECLVLSKINHPAVVKIIAVAVHSSVYFLIEEYLPGNSLEEWSRTNGPLYKSALDTGGLEALRFSKKIVQGLDAVHAQGVYHADINPKNICLRQQDALDPVLIDFGGARFNDVSQDQSTALTVSYSPPEILGYLSNESPSSSDLYSLGLTLYELISGKQPFRGLPFHEAVSAILEVVPPSLKDICPGFPAALSNVIDRLIRKNPSERYRTCHGLLADLALCESYLSQPSREFALGRGEQLRELNYSIPTVGRVEIKKLLREFAEKANANALEWTFIGAPSGTGKTRVAMDISNYCETNGFHVSIAKFSEFERNVPLSTLNRILFDRAERVQKMPPLLRNAWSNEMAKLLGDRGDIFVQRVPFFAKLLPSFPKSSYRDRELESAAFREAYTEFLLALPGPHESHFIFLDDVQWIDDSSLEILRCMLQHHRNGYQARTLVLCTYRSEEIHYSHPIQQQILTHLDTDHSILLGALSEQESTDLVQHLIDENSQSVSKLSAITFEMTRGNPFYIYEFLKACIRDQAFYRSENGAWVFDESKASTIDIGQGLLNLVQERLRTLPEEAFLLVQGAAVIANQMSYDLVEAIYRYFVPQDPALRRLNLAIDALKRENLIKLDKSRFSFSHDRIREAARGSLQDTQAKKIHSVYLDWLLQKQANIHEFESEILFESAHHFMQSDMSLPLSQSVELLLTAGQRAIKLFAYRKARDYLIKAEQLFREMLPEHRTLTLKIALYEALGDAHSLSEDVHEAIRIYEGLVTDVTDSPTLLRLYSKLNQNYLFLFSYHPSLEAGIKGLSILGKSFVKSQMLAILYLIFDIPLTLLVAAYYNLFASKRVPFPEERRSEFALKIAVLVPSFFTLPIPTIYNALPLIREQLKHQENEYMAMLYAYLGVACSVLGLERPARKLYQKALKYFDKHPNPVSTAFIIFVEGYLLDFPLGKLEQSSMRVEQALKISLDIGETFWRFLAFQAQANLDHFGAETEKASSAVESLMAVHEKARFAPTGLSTVVKQKLLEGDLVTAKTYRDMVLEAGVSTANSGLTTIDSIYAFLGTGEYHLLKDEPLIAEPFLKKAFWDVLRLSHRVAYCLFAFPIYASCLCRSQKPFRAIFPLLVSWIHVWLGFKLLYPYTKYATGEFLFQCGLRRLGLWQIQSGYRHAQYRNWTSLATEGRFLFAKLLSFDEPQGALGVLKNVRSYAEERGYVFLENRVSILEESLRTRLSGRNAPREKSESMKSIAQIRKKIEYDSIIEMFSNISVIQEKEKFAEVVIKSFIHCSGAPSVVFFVMSPGDEVKAIGSSGIPLDVLARGDFAGAGIDKNFLDLVLSTRPLNSIIRRGEYAKGRTGSVMITPLQFDSDFLGFVYMANLHVSGLFDNRTQQILEPIAAQVAISLQNYRLIEITRETNINLERLVNERTHALQEANIEMGILLNRMSQGAFTILSNRKIHERYSQHLAAIFQTRDIAHHDAVEFLQNQTKLSGESLNQISAFLGVSLGEDLLNFEMNCDILPKTCLSQGSPSKTLELEWIPIDVDNVVDRILVCVNDQTKILQLEQGAERQSRKLRVISEIIEADSRSLNRFLDPTSQFIDQVLVDISEQPAHRDLIQGIVRQLHTMKGSSRTINLSILSEQVHITESCLLESKLNTDSESIRRIQSSLCELQSLIHMYKEISAWKFRSSESSKNLTESTFEQFIRIRMAPSISHLAKKLGKEMPQLVVVGGELTIDPILESSLLANLSHLLGNAMDHGIETAEERLANGKSTQGELSFTFSQAGDQFELLFEDDGRGLDLERIRAVAIRHNLISPDFKGQAGEIAALIFADGFSSQDTVTHISGRGVGLSSVREMMVEKGGSLELLLDQALAKDVFRFRLKMVWPVSQRISLPELAS